MNELVDARGLACPQPVVLTMRALSRTDQVTVVVDNIAAVENVTRLARARGFGVETSERPDGTYLVLRREGADTTDAPPTPTVAPRTEGPSTVVLVTSNALGEGSAELGERLIAAFFHTLPELAARPQAIVLMNSGVKLAVTGGRALDDLQALAALGVEILVCGTCLSYYELTERVAVGHVSNMYDIATLLLETGKILRI